MEVSALREQDIQWSAFLCVAEPALHMKLAILLQSGHVFSTEFHGFCIPDVFLSPHFCSFVPGSFREVAVGIFLLIHEQDFEIQTQKENFRI